MYAPCTLSPSLELNRDNIDSYLLINWMQPLRFKLIIWKQKGLLSRGNCLFFQIFWGLKEVTLNLNLEFAY